jgi:uncharacterized protein (TIGR02246 family)
MRYVLAVLAACVLIAPLALPAQGQVDEAAIRKNIELWVQSYNKHDAAPIAKMYTQDAMYFTPTGEMYTGPSGVQKYLEETWKQSPKVQIKVDTKQIRGLKPDVAVGHGTYELTNAMGPDGKPMTMKGPWVATFMMQGERWVAVTHAATAMLK